MPLSFKVQWKALKACNALLQRKTSFFTFRSFLFSWKSVIILQNYLGWKRPLWSSSPMVSQPQRKKGVSCCSKRGSCVSVCAIASDPVTGHNSYELGPTYFKFSIQVLVHIDKIPTLSLLSPILSAFPHRKDAPIFHNLCDTSLDPL